MCAHALLGFMYKKQNYKERWNDQYKRYVEWQLRNEAYIKIITQQHAEAHHDVANEVSEPHNLASIQRVHQIG